MDLNINYLELEGKNIVIVEDDLPSVKYYEILLKNSGANVNFFLNGRDFLDYLNTGQPRIDFLFIDLLIPLVNGTECVRIFRRDWKTIPVVMITAYSSEQAKTEAYIAGVNEYVLKPIYPEKLFSLINKYLRTNKIPYSLLN